MNRKFLVAITLAFSALNISAQISISSTDMPLVDDIVIQSNVDVAEAGDFSITGENHNWNFCELNFVDQQIDTMFAVSQTPFAYQLYFNNSIQYPNHKASFAIRGEDISFSQFGQGVDITEVFNYYKNDASDYKQVGFGAKINGVPTSVRYEPIDYIYRFSMDYDNRDTSNSAFGVDIPNMGHYGQFIERINHVEGWGQVTTPYGQFSALKVKTTLNIADTVYVSTLSNGAKIDRPTEYIYSWLTVQQDVPVLTIKTRETNGSENVISVQFRDGLGGTASTCSGTGIGELGDNDLTVYPNPTTNVLNAGNGKFDVMNYLGQTLLTNVSGSVDVSSLGQGTYLLVSKDKSKKSRFQVIK